MIERKSKELESMIFELSTNKREYLYNVRKLFELIDSDGKNVLLGNVNIMETIQVSKISDNEKKILSDKWYALPSNDNRSFNQFVRDLSKSEIDYSLRQVESLLAIEQESLKNAKRNDKAEIQEKINELFKIWKKKKDEELAIYKKKYTEYLQRKFGNIILPPPREIIMKYSEIEEPMVFQLLQAYKRNLILKSPGLLKKMETVKQVKIESNIVIFADYDYLPDNIPYPVKPDDIVFDVTVPEYFDRSDATKRGKLITILELYDLNDYYYSIKQIPLELYQRIKKKLISDTIEYIDFQSVNIPFLKKAMDYFDTTETNTLQDRTSIIRKKWPKNYIPQSEVKDFWGHDLFGTLYNSRNPLDFYQSMIIKNYNNLVKQFTPPGVLVFRKQGILFNEKNGKFGSEAYDGRVYEVQMLDKDFATQQPIVQTKIINEKDPRTGLWIPVNVKTEKRGHYPFILRKVGTNQVGESKEIWMEVPKGAVKLYTPDYDSCNRFTKQGECSGSGMNGLECKWINKKCVTFPK
jgi:hypothetical protein